MSKTNNLGTALVTGASTGIGALYAERLAQRGYDLVLVARSADKLARLADVVSAQTLRKVEVLVADLSQPDQLRTVERRLEQDPNVTLLLNNAGIGATKSLVDSSAEELDRLIELNVRALTRLTRAVVPGMVARRHGTIINISSIVALAPELLNGTYGGTKAYVLAFSQSLQHELGGHGVRVQAVLPGAIRTPFWDLAGRSADQLPPAIVMEPEDLVEAALAGLDQGELVTVPSLPELADWAQFERARQALKPNLSRVKPAARYLS